MLNNTEWLILFFLQFLIFCIIINHIYRKGKNTRNQLKSMKQIVIDLIDGKAIVPSYKEQDDSIILQNLREYLLGQRMNEQTSLLEKKEIQTTISDIAHQIITPVTNIVLYTQLIKEMEVTNPLSSYIMELGIQAEKIDFLVGALTKLSHLETDMLQMNYAKYSVLDLLTNALHLTKTKANQKRIHINLPETNIHCFCDFKWTVEAIGNILDNSIKYSKEETTINISILPNENFVHLQIKDEGMGIEREEIPYIFRRFYRSKQVGKEEGVGIGLYLVREIILAQGGYVYVESDIGKGTSFSVFLKKSE